MCMIAKAAAMESSGMTPRNAAGARDSVSAGDKKLVQQLLSFPQPFTISRPKLYNPLPSKSHIGLFKHLSFIFYFLLFAISARRAVGVIVWLQLAGWLRFNSFVPSTKNTNQKSCHGVVLKPFSPTYFRRRVTTLISTRCKRPRAQDNHSRKSHNNWMMMFFSEWIGRSFVSTALILL